MKEDYVALRTMAAAERLIKFYPKKKLFLYVDTWDQHEPWDPPSWYVELYYPKYEDRNRLWLAVSSSGSEASKK